MDNDRLLDEIHRLAEAMNKQAQDSEKASEFRSLLLKHMEEEKDDRDVLIELAGKVSAHDAQISWLERLFWMLIGAFSIVTSGVAIYWIEFLARHKEL